MKFKVDHKVTFPDRPDLNEYITTIIPITTTTNPPPDPVLLIDKEKHRCTLYQFYSTLTC